MTILIGSIIVGNTGNANATVVGDNHYVSFYFGKDPDTAVMVVDIQEPVIRDARREDGGEEE